MPSRLRSRAPRRQAVEGRFGPVARGRLVRRLRSRPVRIALVSVVLLATVTLATGGALTWVSWYGSQQLGRVEVEHLRQAGDVDGNGTIDVDQLTEVLTVLVVGSDSREGLTDEQLAALGTEREDGNRADTIMLVQLDPRRDQAAVLSFPRDLLVTRCDGSEGRINAAWGIGERTGVGGPTCLVRTITEFTGISINHFVQVNFVGFMEIVDAIGGVRMYLDEPLVDDYAGLDLPAGCVELDGSAALGFVRARRIDSDFGRIARQQRFLREVVAEAVSVGTLVNVPRMLSLVEAVGKAVDADQDLTAGHMRRIAMSLRSMEVDGLDLRTVPGESERIDGAWYVVPDTDAAEPLFAAFRESRAAPGDVGTRELAGDAAGQGATDGAGEAADGEPGDGEWPAVADVPSLTVLNGVGESGLGARTAEALRAIGFAVGTVADAEHYEHEHTTVSYPPALERHAEVVAQAFGGARLERDAGGDLTVVVGGDYELPDASAVVQRAPRRSTPPSPAATPSPSPSATYAGAAPAEHRC